jgi:Zn ribbon nucleic-acid-binding protein
LREASALVMCETCEEEDTCMSYEEEDTLVICETCSHKQATTHFFTRSLTHSLARRNRESAR